MNFYNWIIFCSIYLFNLCHFFYGLQIIHFICYTDYLFIYYHLLLSYINIVWDWLCSLIVYSFHLMNFLYLSFILRHTNLQSFHLLNYYFIYLSHSYLYFLNISYLHYLFLKCYLFQISCQIRILFYENYMILILIIQID
jgi:hypothetical protein